MDAFVSWLKSGHDAAFPSRRIAEQRPEGAASAEQRLDFSKNPNFDSIDLFRRLAYRLSDFLAVPPRSR
jgi:hypothetical protein